MSSFRQARETYLLQSSLPEVTVALYKSPSTPLTSWLPVSLEGFTTDGLPPLPEGTLPIVGPDDFRSYMSTIGNLASNGMEKARTDVSDQHEDGSQTSLGQAMAEIPSQYFQEAYDVDWGSIASSDFIETYTDLVDELARQVDHLEVHLTDEIAVKFKDFMEASSVVQNLRSDVHKLMLLVNDERSRAARLLEITDTHLKTSTALSRRQRNLLSVSELSNKIQSLLYSLKVLEDAVEAYKHSGLDYLSVLSVLEELKKDDGYYSNTQVLAFDGLMRCIEEILHSIKSIMTSDLLDNVKLDEESCMSQACLLSSSQRTQPTLPGQLKENGASGYLHENVVIILSGLHAVEHLNEAMQMCQEYMLVTGRKMIMSCVKKCLLEEQDGSEEPEEGISVPLFKQLDGKAMLQLAESCLLLSKLYVEHCGRVTQSLSRSLDALTSCTPTHRAKYHQIVKDLGHHAARGLAETWASLLTSWTQEKLDFGLEELVPILAISDSFASLIEEQLGKSLWNNLVGAIEAMCKAAVDHMHRRCVTELSEFLEKEMWVYSPIEAAALQSLRNLDRLADSRIQFSNNDKQRDSGGESTLTLGNKAFQLTNTSQKLVVLLGDYAAFAVAVPACLGDVSQRLVELLRTFNSKACQLILGAGAMHVSGLRSITVKHLAVACHSVRLVIALMPALIFIFVSPVGNARGKILEKEYIRTDEDMRLHCEELNNKIVGVVRERLPSERDIPHLISTLVAAVAGDNATPSEPSSFAARIVKQFQVVDQILRACSLPDDADKIIKQVIEECAAALAPVYHSSQLQESDFETLVSRDLSFIEERMNETMAGDWTRLLQGSPKSV